MMLRFLVRAYFYSLGFTFFLNVKRTSTNIFLQGDGRLFESPTLPGGSEIVCVKDKFCHINLYTEYKPSPNWCVHMNRSIKYVTGSHVI